MARVSSIFTYVIPASGAKDEQPPAAPIRCGCDDLILILNDRSLITTSLRGVLLTVIRNVVVSTHPVPYVEPGSGRNVLVWKYDYTLEYDDTVLTDPAYRIRKCDVDYNCCLGCAQIYTDRKLEGYVKSVTGTHVNNTDPQNPVLQIPTFACPEARACFSGVASPTAAYTYTPAAGTHQVDVKVSTTAGNAISVDATGLYVAPVVAPIQTVGCGLTLAGTQVSVNPSATWAAFGFPCADNNGAPIYCDGAGQLRTLPERYPAAGLGTVSVPAAAGDLVNNGDIRQTPIGQVVITNPSNCRNMFVVAVAETRTFGVVIGGSVRLAMVNEIDDGTGFVGDLMRDSKGLIAGVVNNQQDMRYTFQRARVLAPGASATYQFRASIQMTGSQAGGEYQFDGSIAIESNYVVYGYSI